MAEREHGGAVKFSSAHRQEQCVWGQIFDQYVEDTITDEQVQRVLAPVLAMIQAGAFDRPRRDWCRVSPGN